MQSLDRLAARVEAGSDAARGQKGPDFALCLTLAPENVRPRATLGAMTAQFELGNRSAFPDLAAKAYLNHAAISPTCQPVVASVSAALADYARFGVQAFGRWHTRRETLRRDFATLIGAEPTEIALGWNTSRGVTDVALSIPWRRGDRVLLLNGEFPANVTPWQCARDQFGLEIVFMPADDFATDRGLQRLEDELRRGVRLVSVSAVQFQTGLRLPLAEIGALCRVWQAELCVDAIQACGAVPLDMRSMGIHYLVTGGHKWLLGSEGAGFIYVQAERARALRPLTASWLSHEEPLGFLFDGAGLLRYDRPLRASADVFEGGTASLLGFAALGASVPGLCELGMDNVLRHVNAYFDALEPELVRRGFQSARAATAERRSTILSLRVPSRVVLKDFAARLGAAGIVVGTPDGYLRIAPHFANALSEIPLVLDAVDQLLEAPVTAAR
jgi:cysteine desulfurase / selenocysteine lyase